MMCASSAVAPSSMTSTAHCSASRRDAELDLIYGLAPQLAYNATAIASVGVIDDKTNYGQDNAPPSVRIITSCVCLLLAFDVAIELAMEMPHALFLITP